MNVRYKDYDLEIEILTPYRPAPPCSNPSSPVFSDCGDQCEFEIIHGFCDGEKLTGEEIEELYDDNILYQLICDISLEDKL